MAHERVDVGWDFKSCRELSMRDPKEEMRSDRGNELRQLLWRFQNQRTLPMCPFEDGSTWETWSPAPRKKERRAPESLY